MSRSRALIALLTAAALVAGACGGGGSKDDDNAAAGKTTTTIGGAATPYVAQVASYELIAGRDERVLVGVVGNGTGSVVSFGSFDLAFLYLGTKEKPIDPPEQKATAKASFMPLAGHDVAGSATGPRDVRPSEGLGVYRAEGVRFDAAGYWGLRVTGNVGDKPVKLDTVFEVFAAPRVLYPGDDAPRTENPTVATAGANDPALDSRASAKAALPDPELHSTTIAAAITAGKPVVVVVSTPVFCVSQFCGPITDSVQRLAKTYGDRAAFVHLEVWQDFQNKKLNAAAREWIEPKGGGDLQEPWVFLVGRDGKIADRFGNVVSDADLEAAVQKLVA